MQTALSDILIGSGATLRDAMVAINKNGREMVLVAGDDGRVEGLVTDGDIRRGIVGGLTLDSSITTVMNRDFHFVDSSEDRAAVLDLMKARMFQHVPILGAGKFLVGVHFLRDLLGAQPKANAAVILAGGRGTRLRPITEHVPKPMVEVAGRPILERIVLHLVGHGIRRIYLSVNYMAHVIEQHFGDGSRFGCSIEYLREDRPLGTGGPLALLKGQISEAILVLNGDQILQADLSAMLDHHHASGCVATMAVGLHQVEIPFAVVKDMQGRLIALEEKPTLTMTVNRGSYVLEPELLELIPSECEFPITRLFELLLEQAQPVNLFGFTEYWLDVAAANDLRKANGA
jgi:dTDP-glucose pyrophosphorylase